MVSLIRKVISTTRAPAATGPCSRAVLVDRTLYISGQLGMDPWSGQLVPGGMAAEALTNVGETLRAAGCDLTHVVNTTALLADINDFSAVHEIYKQCFKGNFPAGAAYWGAALPQGGRVETEAIAVQGPLTPAALYVGRVLFSQEFSQCF
ncbi:2-iminobutanoate/2-iminopropanoate deaminase-like [Sturnira hondurensis]|uniref:2-iminobutanoate/2-iminopropanoate deaminase-like n=1 Tax=Sturnira hondurensis TaxID=192404 RepID=UPI0018799F0E|nr:2-iminobutanoate/2-iminopropanoate deaminase-like [Sturnira hondurensis]